MYHANETAERRAQVLKTVLVSKCSIKRLSKNHTKCFFSVLLLNTKVDNLTHNSLYLLWYNKDRNEKTKRTKQY